MYYWLPQMVGKYTVAYFPKSFNTQNKTVTEVVDIEFIQ